MSEVPEELALWVDRDVIDKNGKSVGRIADIYIDDLSGEPEWLAIVTGLFGNRISFAPLAGATEEGESAVRVIHEKSTIKDSPNVDADGELSPEEEARLYRHYGLRYERSATSGSASLTEEPTPELAIRRLRRRDAAAVEFIDLDGGPAKPAEANN